MLHTTDSLNVRAVQNKGLEKDHFSGLRSPGWLGQRPLIGILMIIVGLAVFAVAAIGLQTHSTLIQIDTQIDNNIHTIALNSSHLIVGVMIFGFYLGEHVIVAIGAILVVYFLYKRFWAELAMVLIAWGGEGGIWLLLSQYFNRPRPTFATPVWHLMTAPGFPSGHSFSAVLCFGLLAYLIVPKMPTRTWKIAVIVAAVGIILFIGFSRMFVGDHYPSDVLAGYGLGVAWGGLVYTTIELIARSHKARKQSELSVTAK